MNDIAYTLVGEYYLPNLVIGENATGDSTPLGKYGKLHKEYLQKEKPALYAELLLTGRLYPLCREIDESAAHKLETIPDRNLAHEVILAELVYC